MTPKKLLLFTFLQLVLLLIFKVILFKHLGIEYNVYRYLYWSALFILIVALTRRLGVINFLEAFFVGSLWFLLDLFSDALITVALVGTIIFKDPTLWTGYVLLLVGVFVFHKKRHIHIRHQSHAAAHPPAHGTDHKPH